MEEGRDVGASCSRGGEGSKADIHQVYAAEEISEAGDVAEEELAAEARRKAGAGVEGGVVAGARRETGAAIRESREEGTSGKKDGEVGARSYKGDGVDHRGRKATQRGDEGGGSIGRAEGQPVNLEGAVGAKGAEDSWPATETRLHEGGAGGERQLKTAKAPKNKESKYGTYNEGYVAHSLEVVVGHVKDYTTEDRVPHPTNVGALAIVPETQFTPYDKIKNKGSAY